MGGVKNMTKFSILNDSILVANSVFPLGLALICRQLTPDQRSSLLEFANVNARNLFC